MNKKQLSKVMSELGKRSAKKRKEIHDSEYYRNLQKRSVEARKKNKTTLSQ